MTNNEERRVRARHDVTQVYRRQGVKRTASRQDLPRGDMIISDHPNPNNSSSSADDDIDDDTYPHPRLVLMKKVWLVQVGAGQQQMKKLKKRSRKKMIVEQRHLGPHLIGLLEGKGSHETSPRPLFGNFLACYLGCASPNMSQM
jgi:hypothetical protein